VGGALILLGALLGMSTPRTAAERSTSDDRPALKSPGYETAPDESG
jgi:hypothetical protein